MLEPGRADAFFGYIHGDSQPPRMSVLASVKVCLPRADGLVIGKLQGIGQERRECPCKPECQVSGAFQLEG